MSNNSGVQTELIDKIQIKRSLQWRGDKDTILDYIRKDINDEFKLSPGEPVVCTYQKADGTLGAIEIICLYSKGTIIDDTIRGYIPDELIDNDNKLVENIIKVNDDITYNDLQNIINNKIENGDFNGIEESEWDLEEE